MQVLCGGACSPEPASVFHSHFFTVDWPRLPYVFYVVWSSWGSQLGSLKEMMESVRRVLIHLDGIGVWEPHSDIWGSWAQQLLLQLTAPSCRFMTDPSKQMKLRSTLPSLAFILRDCAHFWVNGSSLLIYQNKDAVWQTFESDTWISCNRSLQVEHRWVDSLLTSLWWRCEEAACQVPPVCWTCA
jgi:hypothetical protein